MKIKCKNSISTRLNHCWSTESPIYSHTHTNKSTFDERLWIIPQTRTIITTIMMIKENNLLHKKRDMTCAYFFKRYTLLINVTQDRSQLHVLLLSLCYLFIVIH
ncbi:hypothetical protein Smp_059610 [Schistosoma mansoni]|uniref:hypothetical protein n=1 Tax=Schistosoma mansoni TaxID=6183 RepID=UPI0001A643ED|nr:hypothetical protein Smp_059610 [Schistosoma mansoni]|eukprot:XP_018653250.1 hypothetical protein Smp_059610 [Schistosoma mansoni]